MSRWIATGLILVAIVGCSDSRDSTGSAESGQTPAEETPQAVEEAVEREVAEGAQVANEIRDLAGLSVGIRDDGTITLSGADRWGGRIDTTYASLEFLTNAVPSLKRGVTHEQGSALDALIEELSATGGENGQ